MGPAHMPHVPPNSTILIIETGPVIAVNHHVNFSFLGIHYIMAPNTGTSVYSLFNPEIIYSLIPYPTTLSLEWEELEPNWKMMMFERLGAPGEESSNGFNNAGGS